MSYGPSLPAMWEQDGALVAKVLKGAKPSDLPVEQPSKFELVINLKTARALGLSVSNQMQMLADEVIVTVSTPVTAALQRETNAIPIVFLGVSDPIGSGFAANLARPGSNLTGIMLYEVGIAGKWLTMLKEIAPRVTRVALVAGPKTTAYNYFVRNAEAAGPSLGIEIVPTPVADAADIERGIEAFSRVPNGGLLLPSDGTTIVHRDLVIALAARHNLPAVYALRVFVTAGGLMSYSTELDEARSNRRPRLSIASYEAPNQSTFRCRHLPSIRRRSTSRPRRRSALLCRRAFLWPPTR